MPQRGDYALAGLRWRLGFRGQPVGKVAGYPSRRTGRCDQDPCCLDQRRQRAGCHQPYRQRRTGIRGNHLGYVDVSGCEGRQEAMGTRLRYGMPRVTEPGRGPALLAQSEGNRGGGRGRTAVQGIIPHCHGRRLPCQPSLCTGQDLPAGPHECVVPGRSPKSGPSFMSIDLKYVDEAVEQIGSTPDAVIPILQAMQDHYGYLPEEALRRVCTATQITPAAIAGVSTFYDMFRHEPSGKHIVHVCHGTACHVGGAERVEDALRRHLHIPDGSDTDADRRFTIERVACLGCCTLAPVVRIEQETIGYATAEKVPGAGRDFLASRQSAVAAKPTVGAPTSHNGGAEIKVCLDSCCLAKGTDRVFQALQQSLALSGANATVKRVGCVGACYKTPMIEVAVPGRSSVTYAGLTQAQAGELVQSHFRPRGLARRVSQLWTKVVDGLLVEDDAAAPQVERLTVNRNDPS